MKAFDLNTRPVEAHHPEVLQSDEGEGRAILLFLPAGERLQEHRVQERAYLHVVQGSVEIVAGDVTRAAAGTLAIFEPAEDHEIRAIEDARLLLVLAPWPAPTHRGETREARAASRSDATS
jgi:quercetin dioxygenase-like cupin family protein